MFSLFRPAVCKVSQFTQAVKELGRSTCWQHALSLAQRRRPIPFDTCSAAITACGNGQQWQVALQLLWQHVRQAYTSSAHVFVAAINACSRVSQWQRACALLKIMRLQKVPENLYAYSSVISALRGAAQWKDALQVLIDMESRTVERNVVILNGVLSVCAAAGEWQQACQLFYEASKQYVDEITYNTVLNALSEGAQWQLALHCFETFPSNTLEKSARAVASVMKACQRAEQWPYALTIFQLCCREGIGTNLVVRNIAISSCAAGSLWHAAVALTCCQEADVRSYNAALTALANEGLWERSLQLLAHLQIRRCKVSVVTYNSVLAACERSGQWEFALQFLCELSQIELQADAITFNTLISTCTKARRWLEGVKLLMGMRKAGFTTDVMIGTAIMKACTLSGQWQWALCVLSLYGSCADLALLSAGMSACKKSSQWQIASWLSSSVRQRRLNVDVVAFNSLISSMVVTLIVKCSGVPHLFALFSSTGCRYCGCKEALGTRPAPQTT